MRDSINKAGWIGPRMFVAGYGLSARASSLSAQHRHDAHRARPRLQHRSDPRSGEAAGRRRRRLHQDVRIDRQRRRRHRQRDVHVRRDEGRRRRGANHFGKRIAIHSYGPDGGRDAVRAGATSLEHAIDLDDATLAEMARDAARSTSRRSITIATTREYTRGLSATRRSRRPALDSFRLLNFETARRAFKAGVKLGMGSDAVFTSCSARTRASSDGS